MEWDLDQSNDRRLGEAVPRQSLTESNVYFHSTLQLYRGREGLGVVLKVHLSSTRRPHKLEARVPLYYGDPMPEFLNVG